MGGQLNNPRGSTLRGEAMNRLHLDYLMTEGPDDSPATDGGAGGHG